MKGTSRGQGALPAVGMVGGVGGGWSRGPGSPDAGSGKGVGAGGVGERGAHRSPLGGAGPRLPQSCGRDGEMMNCFEGSFILFSPPSLSPLPPLALRGRAGCWWRWRRIMIPGRGEGRNPSWAQSSLKIDFAAAAAFPLGFLSLS